MSTDQLSPLVADLHLLTVLAATKSFTETARRLGTSKASVSMRISELERTAGVLLVRRTTRSVGLTEAGQQMVADMQPAFERISGSYSAARDLVGMPRGLVRVTAPVALGRQHLAPCIAAFLQQFPDIHIELELTDRFVNLANEGFDLAIRHTNAAPETHVAWVLCETRSVLVASADYLARRGMPAHPADLAAHDCLLYLGSQSGNWTFAKTTKRKSSERVSVNIRGSLKVNNSEVLREALLAGLGIGLLPDFSLPKGQAPTLLASPNALHLAGRRPAEPSLLKPVQTCESRFGAAGFSPEGAELASGGSSLRAFQSGQAQLVRVLPDWQVQGFFGERIYALRPWSAQVPMAVQCLVEHLRASFTPGFASGFGDGEAG